jgi:hypothetical protein
LGKFVGKNMNCLEVRFMTFRYCILIFSLIIICNQPFTTTTSASELEIPHSFSNGQPANADHVNENFAAIQSAVNDNNENKVSRSGDTINGNLTVIGSLTIAEIMSRVTYSAMGFVPKTGFFTQNRKISADTLKTLVNWAFGGQNRFQNSMPIFI